MPSKYSDETKDKILKLWNAGMSSQRIADRFGFNKNIVVSLLKRLRNKGLEVRIGKQTNKNPYKTPKAYKKYKPAPQAPIIYESPKDYRIPKQVKNSKERWVPLLHLANETCRYTKDGKLFCNAPSKGSYCEEHLSSMYSGLHSFRGVSLRSFLK